MTYIIGINGNLHDSSLVAFNRENETLEYYYSEDRHSGVPHHYGFPHASIEKLRTKINFSAIEAIALSRDVEKYIFPPLNYYSDLEEKLREPMRLILSDLYYKNHDKSIDSRLNKATCSVRKLLDSIRIDYKTTGKSTFYYQKKICYLIHNILLEVALLEDIRIHFGDIKVMSIEHHLCHASLSMTSKFDSCTIISWDGRGEFDSTNLWKMDRKVKQPIELIRSIKHPFSLGLFYNLFVEYCGFNKESGPGKLMGLSAYGKPTFSDLFANMITVNEDFDIKYNDKLIQTCDVEPLSLTPYTQKLIGPPSKSWKDSRIQDIAYGAQQALESAALQLLESAIKITRKSNVHFSGGVALNCLMNGKLFKKTSDYDIYPACGDDGTAYGAAIACHLDLKRDQANSMISRISNYEIGKIFNLTFKDSEIICHLKECKLEYEFAKTEIIADLILKNQIIGVLKNSYEIGPRALGTRSIIGNAFSEKTWSHINSEIKFREDFRPFAPMILDEDLGIIFGENSKLSTNYMLTALPVESEVKIKIPSVVHKNGTARVQKISAKNGFYFDLLQNIKSKKGLGVCINTSLNIAGESIIDTPQRLVEFFAISALDAIVIGPFLIERNANIDSLKTIKNQLSNRTNYINKRTDSYALKYAKTGKQEHHFKDTFEKIFSKKILN